MIVASLLVLVYRLALLAMIVFVAVMFAVMLGAPLLQLWAGVRRLLR